MGSANRCFIELDTPTLSAEKMESIEGICNELIRKGVPMTPRWYSANDSELEAVSFIAAGYPRAFTACSHLVQVDGLA